MLISDTNEWKDFWSQYRNREVENEFDLYFQVGRTSNKEPMPAETLQLILDDIDSALQLTKKDRVLEFCCGNGLITFELKDKVNALVAVDFTQHLIEAANKFKSSDNIKYCLGSALNPISTFDENTIFTKYLMCDSLAYFKPADIRTLLENIIQSNPNPFTMLFASVPDEDRKMLFYNTPYRLEWFNTQVEIHETTYDPSCIGRWWRISEIENICKDLGLNCHIRNSRLYNYRYDIIIQR